jgi:hypothetical protein
MTETYRAAEKTPDLRHPGKSPAQDEKLQRQLDDALADSFPASDPVSIVTSQAEEDWGEPESQAGD